MVKVAWSGKQQRRVCVSPPKEAQTANQTVFSVHFPTQKFGMNFQQLYNSKSA